MLTAQLKCNPLYLTTWQNDRNITNQEGEGVARELVKDPESSPHPQALLLQLRRGQELQGHSSRGFCQGGLGWQYHWLREVLADGGSHCFYGNIVNQIES